jgi:hypothetical protein
VASLQVMSDATVAGGATPVIEDPEEVTRTKLGKADWEKLLKLPKDRPRTWVRLRWFESDRGAERAAIRLRAMFPESDGWEFTSRRIKPKEGGGSKVFARWTATSQQAAQPERAPVLPPDPGRPGGPVNPPQPVTLQPGEDIKPLTPPD